MNLERQELTGAFREFIAHGDGVVIGAPGVGKTHLLKQVVQELRAAPEYECLFLPADRMPFESDADLRAELGATGDVLSFLEHRTHERRGYLVVDALDAVRGDRPRAFVLGLVRRVRMELSDSWTVVLSMRTYDALRSVELDEIFPPAVNAAADDRYRTSGAVCRHFYVPPLDDAEIEAASRQLPWLAGLWNGGIDDLRDLLRVPFNLWLLERLFERGAGSEEVSPVQSEVELLNLFWRQRIRSGPLEPDQRRLASRTAAAMVRNRTLWADTNDAYEAGANAAWLALHSAEVLQDVNEEGTRVAFAHNVLFDYAASVELLDDDAAALADFLRQEPDRALFLRPTLNYFFARLWFTQRSRFWEIFWTLFDADEPQVRLVAQVLPPGIAAREARSLDDLEPLLARLDQGAPHAESEILRVLQAVRTHGIADDTVWAAFSDRAAQRASRIYSWDLARFLAELLEREEQGDQATAAVRSHVAAGARSLLRLALDSDDRGLEHVAAIWLVGVVARTYEVDAAGARALFETILSRIGDVSTSVDLIYRLADSVQHFWTLDPELVAAVYAAIFAHVERSEEPTHMGGIVVALRSNRRQDFEMAQYVLLGAAPRFLREQPVVAMRALVEAATGAAVVRERLDDDLAEETFDFRGQRVRYRQDSSHIWDASGTVHEDAQTLVEMIVAYLGELPAGSAELAEAVDTIAGSAASAFIWRSLLKAAVRDAEKYAALLHELLLAQPVLANPETAPEAAAFLGVVAPLLDDSHLRRIEDAVVELAGRDLERTRHWARRLVAQIPEEHLTTDAARELREEALSDPEAWSNRPLISFSTFSEGYDEEHWLRDQGIATGAPANRRLLAATEELQEFASRYMNEANIPAEAVTEMVVSLAAALALLQPRTDLPAPLLDTVWARMGEAAAVAARSETLDEDALTVLRQALLACASGEAPRPTDNPDDTFNVPAWSPAARNGAAQGLPRLLQHCTDEQMLATLVTLARDPAPSVRYLLATELPRLVREHEESFWALARGYADTEGNRVVQQALGNALMAVTSLSDRETRVTDTLDQLLRRAPLAELASSLPHDDRVGALVVGLAVVRGNDWATVRLDDAVREAPASLLSTVVLHLLHYVDYQRVADSDSRPTVEAALRWLPQIIERVQCALRDEVERTQRGDSDRTEAIRELFGVLDHIISRFYFGSGLYDGRGPTGATQTDICAFFEAIRPVLQQLGEVAGGTDGVGLPARSAHHFIELLRGSLACDPAAVLHLTRLTVDAARGGGYAFDPMAAREVTAIVETTLADHREVARTGQPLDDLMRVLDVFVDAGWAEAQRLVWRLEELFR